ITAEEIHLDLHGIIEPAKEVDVIPPFLVIAAWFVVMDVHLVLVLAIEILIEIWLQNIVEYRQLTALLGTEGVRIVQDIPIAVPQDIGRKPAVESQLPRF